MKEKIGTDKIDIKMSNVIKFLLAIMLLLCLLKMPYGYFQFIRIAGAIGFGYLCYSEFQQQRSITGLLCALCTILLQPVFKIHFTREIWNKIDVIIAIFLLIWTIIDLFLHYGKSNKKEISQ